MKHSERNFVIPGIGRKDIVVSVQIPLPKGEPCLL
jgi:hypothetical protein